MTDASHTESTATTPHAGEQIVWTARPSAWVAGGVIAGGTLALAAVVVAGIFFWPLFFLAAPIVIAVIVTVAIQRSPVYTLTTQRLRVRTGLIVKHEAEVELYRVTDSRVVQTFFQRIIGIGTIVVVSNDSFSPRLDLRAVPRAFALREEIRNRVESRRISRGVREVEMQ